MSLEGAGVQRRDSGLPCHGLRERRVSCILSVLSITVTRHRYKHSSLETCKCAETPIAETLRVLKGTYSDSDPCSLQLCSSDIISSLSCYCSVLGARLLELSARRSVFRSVFRSAVPLSFLFLLASSLHVDYVSRGVPSERVLVLSYLT